MNEKIIIDAKESILGRVASYAAKQALLGKNVVVLNCNEVLVTGGRNMVIERYARMRRRGKGTQKGPIVPRVAEKLVKRTIRGMLDYTKKRGETAFDKIRCYNKVPKEFESVKKISLAGELKTRTTKLGEIAKII